MPKSYSEQEREYIRKRLKLQRLFLPSFREVQKELLYKLRSTLHIKNRNHILLETSYPIKTTFLTS